MSQPYVFIKVVSDTPLLRGGSGFVKLPIAQFVDIADITQGACVAFSHWGVAADEIELYAVTKAGKAPTSVEMNAALLGEPLSPIDTLVDVNVISGSCLLAHVTGHGRALVSRTVGGSSLPSVSEAVGPTFEHEAREVLGSVFREICPWARDHSRLLSRKLDRGDNAREADVLCYIEGDSLEPCLPSRVNGIEVIELPAVEPPLPPVTIPAGTRFSPTDATRTGPHKYFLAEAYSGANENTMVEKVVQLETLCGFLCARWAEQHSADECGEIADVTELIGAAALVFSSGDAPRCAALTAALALVRRTAMTSPVLSRLMRAGRLLVIVLDKSQSPLTYFQRAVACRLERLDSVPEAVEDVREGIARLEAAFGAGLNRG